jgi:hypothetical protein
VEYLTINGICRLSSHNNQRLFTASLAQAFFQSSLLTKIAAMTTLQTDMAVDAAVVASRADLTAFITGYCLAGIVRSSHRWNCNVKWSILGDAALQLCTRDTSASDLPSDVTAFFVTKTRGGLVMPVASLFQLFLTIDARLAALGIDLLRQDFLWTDICQTLSTELVPLVQLRPQPPDTKELITHRHLAAALTKTYRRIYVKAAVRTCNFKRQMKETAAAGERKKPLRVDLQQDSQQSTSSSEPMSSQEAQTGPATGDDKSPPRHDSDDGSDAGLSLGFSFW